MKKQKNQANINIEKLAGGAFAEKFNEALMAVAENIQNPNTDATAKRAITINIKFAPNKSRQLVNATIGVTTKLASTEEIDTQMIMGVNMKTGKVEIAEYDRTGGQLSVWDEVQEEAEEPQTAEQASVVAPNGKPLDLRTRGRKQEAGDLALVDTVTGEVYETDGQPEDDDKKTAGRVIIIGNRAAQA